MKLFNLSKSNSSKLHTFSKTTNPPKKSIAKIKVVTPNRNNVSRTQFDFFLTSNPKLKKFNNSSSNFSFHSEEDLSQIYALLDNYKNINTPFDGMSVMSQKQSIENLINKLSKKEKKFCFEENKLMKKPYPLLEFLSNRKYYNNTSKLILDLLTAQNRKLTKEQQNMIQSHYKSFHFMKRKIYNSTQKKKDSKINLKKLAIVQKNFQNREKNLIPLFNKYLKNKLLKVGGLYNKKFFSYSNGNSPNKHKKINEKYGLNNQIFSYPTKKKSVNLLCHDTNCSNVSVIKNRIMRINKDKFNLTDLKKFKNNIISNEILKDISKLKTNKCLTKFLTEIKTI